MQKKLLYYTQFKDNNFDFLRLLAAVLVLFSHSYPLTGNNVNEWLSIKTEGFMTFGGLAVACFFIISGFLITASMLNRKSVIDYSISRILRIFPGLILSVLICALIIGPWVTSLSIGLYFNSGQLYAFIFHNSVLWKLNNYLPGVFGTNVYPRVVNGSLWTLPLEVSLYIVVGVLGITRLLSKKIMTSLLVISLLLLPLFLNNMFGFFSTMPKFFNTLQPYYCFGLGILFYLWREKIMIHGGILCLLAGITFLARHTEFLTPVFFLAFAYFIFYIAYHRKIKLNLFTQWGDFSYGVYIYAFPVQQVIMHYFNFTQSDQLFLAAFCPTLFLAILSWYFIEHPALMLKSKVKLNLKVFKPVTLRHLKNLDNF